jgi:rubrerythrin
MDSTDDEDHSNARWFYRRCSAARISMETPLSTLELSLRVLRFVESIVVDVDGEEEEEEEDDCDDRASSSSQLRLFDDLRDGCRARRRDLSFVYDVCDRALDLRDDGEFTEAALRAVAKAEEAAGDGDGGCIGLESRDIGDDAVADAAAASAAVASGEDVEAIIVASGIVDPSDGRKITSDVAAAAASSAPSRSARGGESSSARADDNDDDDHQRGEQHVDIDGLRCFQLRTRVFGLSLPTFTTELWRYLQLAGWTHSHYTGKYHIPKRIKERRYDDSEDMAKRMYKHFNLDDGHARGRNGTEHPSSGDGEGADDADEEEGPEIFDSSNELVDYLDEYCMPDYRATMAEVEAARVALSAHTSAYRRRNLRLRLDLLEVVHRERLRKSLARREEESRSKYGHSHRPCEVCFRGANPVYPRVACRDCGLVVHTNCYGLTDHAEKKGGDGNGAEVDEKGYFTCDVCAIKCVFPRKIGRKQLYHASQRSGWRVHQHPDAACPLCGWNHITGGMVRIAADDSDAAVPSDAKSRKRKSRRSEDSESWVHLFCMNALPLKRKVSPGSVRSGGDATVHIRNMLNESSEMVREVDVSFPPEKNLF